MSIPANVLIPAAAAAAFVVTGIGAALGTRRAGRPGRWLVPAVLAAVFFAGSLIPVRTGGMLGFWGEHTRNDWNNQIFLDLLLCGGCAYFLLLDRARRVSMRVLPWFLAIATLGSIGLLAMVARVLFLEERARISALQFKKNPALSMR